MTRRLSLGGLSLASVLAGSMLLTGAGGCGGVEGEGAELDQAEAVERVSSALSTHDFSDWSDTVHVRVKVCDWSHTDRFVKSTCKVDPDYVTVGGGAEIEGTGNPALLKASRPQFFEDDTDEVGSEYPIGGEAWSSDHIRQYRHRVRAYVIGLRLSGLSRQQLLENMQVKVKSSYASSLRPEPSVTVYLDRGYILTGGGAFAEYRKQFLVSSHGFGRNWWHAKSKDHLVSSPGSVRAYAIGIRQCPTGYAGCLESSTSKTSTSVSTGYGAAVALTDPGFVVTGVGGLAEYQGSGRMLTDLRPITRFAARPRQGAFVVSKDHERVDGGETYAVARRLRKQP